MSVTSQALTHAINHIESLMKQAATETKKAIDNSAFDENDYFVITLELTPLGFTSDVSIESDKFEVMCYHPNVVAIFVDLGSKFLSWENPTADDIEAFKDMLVIKLEQAEKYDTLADRLAKPLQTRNISITDEDLEQSTLAFLEKHGIDSETFVETLANNLSFNKDSIFKEANVRYFRGFLEQPFKHLATASSDDGRLMLNDVFESKGIHFSFEALEPMSDDKVVPNHTVSVWPIDKPITWAGTKTIVLKDNDSETGGPSHADETLDNFLEEIGAMPEDCSAEIKPFTKCIINYMLDVTGIKPAFTHPINTSAVVEHRISSAVFDFIKTYNLDNGSNEQVIFFIARDGSLIYKSDERLPYILSVRLTAPNGSNYHSSLQLSSILNNMNIASVDLDTLTEAVVSELKQKWQSDLVTIDTLANYSGSFIYGNTISDPKRKIPMKDLLEDQQYFRQASKRLGENIPSTKEE